MIPLAIVAMIVGPFLFGPLAYVLALGLFALAALDIDGRRRDRRLAARRERDRLDRHPRRPTGVG